MTLPPESVRRFRGVLRKCLVGKGNQGLAVRIRADGESLTLFADLGEVAVRLRVPHAGRKESLVVPVAFLPTLEGAGREPVELRRDSAAEGVARWSRDGLAVERPFAIPAADAAKEPPSPSEWAAMPPRFLAALHEAGRTAARAPTKFALNRVQLRGRGGRLVASDSKQGLIQSGFAFPFAEDLLVPAVPVFGLKELAGEARLGRTESGLAIAVGDWTVWLGADGAARFPDLESVVPRAASPTRIDFGASDAAWLLDRANAERFPAVGGNRPVTVDADPGRVLLRGGAPTDAGVEVRLSATRASGPPVRLALEWALLERPLRLGFRGLVAAGPTKPVVARDDGRTYLAMVLDVASVVPPSPTRSRIATPEMTLARSPLPPEEPTVKPAPTPNPPPAPPEPERPPDPLTEATALKAALWEAARHAGRLLVALKAGEALDRVLGRLPALGPGPRGES